MLSLSLPPLVNKAHLAEALGVSLPTMGAWIKRYGDAFPLVERGTNGRAWRFDPRAVAAFLAEKRAEEAAKTSARDELLAQLILPLFTDAAHATAAPPAISLDDQLKARRLNDMNIAAAIKARQLVPADAMQFALADVFATWSRLLHTTLRAAGHDMNLPDHVVRGLDTRLTDTQHALAQQLAEFFGAPAAPPDDDTLL